VNTFKNIFQLNWNRKLLNYISCVIRDRRHLSLCLLMPAVYFLHCWLQWNQWNGYYCWIFQPRQLVSVHTMQTNPAVEQNKKINYKSH